jgi:hypothetical protein
VAGTLLAAPFFIAQVPCAKFKIQTGVQTGVPNFGILTDLL